MVDFSPARVTAAAFAFVAVAAPSGAAAQTLDTDVAAIPITIKDNPMCPESML